MSRSDFVGLDGVVHLAAGGESPVLRAVSESLDRFLVDKGKGYVGGYSGRSHFYQVYDAAKARLGGLLGVPEESLALLSSASEGLCEAVSHADVRPGENVIIPAGEFPSVSLPWVLRATDGVQIREVTPGPGQRLTEAILDAADKKTRVIAVSHVSYLTGERVNLPRLRECAAANGSVLIVDASHSLGVLPVPAESADFVVSCCYKFMLGIHGVGVFYWNRNKVPSLAPSRVGWHSVRTFPPEEGAIDWKADADRLEHGNPNFVGVYALEASTHYLGEIGAGRLESHVLELGSVLWDQLHDLGLDVTTPRDLTARGPNVCFRHPRADELTEQLREERIYVWGGHGRVRVSLHGYNDDADVAALIGALKRIRIR